MYGWECFILWIVLGSLFFYCELCWEARKPSFFNENLCNDQNYYCELWIDLKFSVNLCQVPPITTRSYSAVKIMPPVLYHSVENTTTLVIFASRYIGFQFAKELTLKFCCWCIRLNTMNLPWHLSIWKTLCSHMLQNVPFVLRMRVFSKSPDTISRDLENGRLLWRVQRYGMTCQITSDASNSKLLTISNLSSNRICLLKRIPNLCNWRSCVVCTLFCMRLWARHFVRAILKRALNKCNIIIIITV